MQNKKSYQNAEEVKEYLQDFIDNQDVRKLFKTGCNIENVAFDPESKVLFIKVKELFLLRFEFRHLMLRSEM